jgi:hypothetical protein
MSWREELGARLSIYKQVGGKLQTRDFILNKLFVDEVGYCLWIKLNVDFGEVGCRL